MASVLPIDSKSYADADGTSKTFADVVGNSSSSDISLKTPGSHRGEPAVFFSDEDVALLSSPFKFALVGKFSHGRPSIAEIRSVFETIGLKAAFNIGLLDQKHILIRFFHEEDFQRMWLREQWYIKKFPMRVFKWSPQFRVDAESSIAPIWVSLPYLPVQFFSKHSVFSIVGTFGTPMKLDAATSSLSRPSLARVCVEMDLCKKFPTRVWVGWGEHGFWQRVEYEKIPKYCSKCLKQGHELFECKLDGSNRDGWVDAKEGRSNKDKFIGPKSDVSKEVLGVATTAGERIDNSYPAYSEMGRKQDILEGKKPMQEFFTSVRTNNKGVVFSHTGASSSHPVDNVVVDKPVSVPTDARWSSIILDGVDIVGEMSNEIASIGESGEDDDKSVAFSDSLRALKIPNGDPLCIRHVGLSPKAMENLGVSYSIFYPTHLKVALLRDKEVLDRRMMHMSLVLDDEAVLESVSVVNQSVTPPKRKGRERKNGRKKGGTRTGPSQTHQ